MRIATTNPATGEVLKSYEPMSTEQLDAAIERADLAFRDLHRTTVAQRGGGWAPPPTCSTPSATTPPG